MEKYKILNTVDYPVDIKKLKLKELKELSSDVSLYIHDVITVITKVVNSFHIYFNYK